MHKWAVIRTANHFPVVIAPFDDYDAATEWAKRHSDENVGCRVVALRAPEDYGRRFDR